MKGTGTVGITCGCSATIPSDALCGSPPIGWLESSTQQANCTNLGGWAFDPDYAGSITVHVYNNGVFYTALAATGSRPDVGAVYPGHTNSGYSFAIPQAWHDGVARSIVSYGLNVNAAGALTGGPNPALSGTPVNLVCPPAPTITFSALPATVNQGSTSTITWTTTNATACTASGGDAGWPGARPVAGNYVTQVLLLPATYTLTCVNAIGDSVVRSVTVGVNAMPPVSTIKTIAPPDYCTSGPLAIVTWNYSSAPGLSRKNWQIQIANDAGFTSLAYDSGVLAFAPEHRSFWSGVWHTVISFLGLDALAAPVTQDYTNTVGQGALVYNKTYYMRVRAWDTVNAAPGAWSATGSFSTPTTPYPQVSFSLTPAKPVAGQPTTFTDTTQYGGASPLTRIWNFGDGTVVTENPGTGTIDHTYAAESAGMTVTLTVVSTSSSPKTCQNSMSFSIAKPIPVFKEVRP
jgi:hypothetical protein